MTHEDIQKLQSVGRAAQEERRESILLDNSAAAWKQLSSIKEGRVDLVLDNGMSPCICRQEPYITIIDFKWVLR